MPKYAVHTLVALKTAERLRGAGVRIGDDDPGSIMLDNRGLTVVGAIGPDLFFWAPDYEVCQVLLEILDAWDRVKTIYDNTIGKVVEAIEWIGDRVEDLAEALAPGLTSLFGAMMQELEETADLFEKTIRKGTLALVLGLDDLIADAGDMPTVTKRIFDMFKPPSQDGKPEQDWYWFDMLHYRYTGDFARALLENATTPAQKAYAYGYITHVATDVVGHGYVNQIVGGPYRTHVQRHVVVENFIDAWAFREYVGGDIATDLLDWLDLPDSLPEDVVDLIHRAFIETYSGVPHPMLIHSDGFLTKADIRTTYNLFKRVTEKLEDHIRPPEEPFSGVLDILEEVLENFVESLAPPSPPKVEEEMCSAGDIFSFGATESSRECYSNFVESLGDWLKWLAELALWSLELIKKIFDLLATFLSALPVMAILGLLYLIQLGLYKIMMWFREILALHGLAYPPSSLLDTAHGRNLITPYQCEFSAGPYPRVSGDEICLQCPSAASETPNTLPASYPEDATPKTFIEGMPLNEEALRNYATAKAPEETRRLYLSVQPSPVTALTPVEAAVMPMGSALEVASWMIENCRDPLGLVNWNLDSDRGFGYKHWKGILPTSPPNHKVLNERYLP